MKKTLLLAFVTAFIFSQLQSQSLISRTIQHDGLTRTYKLYVPNIYTTAGVSVPLMFNIHGLGSNADQQHLYSEFAAIADTENFIICLPNGTNNGTGQQFFNAGFGNTVDDIGFINALIDTLIQDYDIDTTKIFSTGMSNGGFMSLTLACELSNRIAKVASVTGTMTLLQANNCAPEKGMPVMLIHGTLDLTVPYNGIGGTAGTFLSVDSVINFWKRLNETDATAVYNAVPNISTTDGSTAERFDYTNGIDNSSVVLYKITGGGHTWPGATFLIPGNGNTNQDVEASEEIWKFFKGEEYNSVRNIEEKLEFSVYPNPAQNIINIEVENAKNISIYNILGTKVFNLNSTDNSTIIDISALPKGVYMLTVSKNSLIETKKIVKN
jgi:polyhydroxybutyrate depolymerase